MKIDFLLDTDWVIHYMRGESSIVQILNNLVDQDSAPENSQDTQLLLS